MKRDSAIDELLAILAGWIVEDFEAESRKPQEQEQEAEGVVGNP